MKLTVRENRIELEPESHLENDAIARWRSASPRISSSGVKCQVIVEWSRDRYVDTNTLTISFDTPK